MDWGKLGRRSWWTGDEGRARRDAVRQRLVARAGRSSATQVNALVDALPERAVTILEGLTGTALGDWGTGGDPELRGYTRLTGRDKDGKLRRDLTPMSQEQHLQVAHWLYTSNPLSQWMIDQRVDLLVGSEMGYSVEFDHEALGLTPEKAKKLAAEVKGFLDDFWDDPGHSLRFRAREYVTTLMVSGELTLILTEANEVTGLPGIDYLDSQLISDVKPLDDSSMVPGTVLVKRKNGDPNPKPYDIVNTRPPEPVDPDMLDTRDRCFYWRSTRVLNSMRGRSELLAQADFLDALDQFMFSQVDRAILINHLVWDLELEGATEPQIAQRVKELSAQLSKPGAIFGRNEKGKLTPVAPNLQASEGSELQRTLANHIRGSKSLPESWYADGGNANRATAGDQTDVAYKTLEAWQTFIRSIFTSILGFAYDRLREKQKNFPDRAEGGVKLIVDLPPVRERDMVRAAATASQVETSLEAAVESQFISRRTARKVFLQVLEKLSGVAVDPDDEAAAIEAEEGERAKLDAERRNNAARDALDRGLDEPDDPKRPEPKVGALRGNAA